MVSVYCFSVVKYKITREKEMSVLLELQKQFYLFAILFDLAPAVFTSWIEFRSLMDFYKKEGEGEIFPIIAFKYV
jgi:hypothetical protein